MAISAPAAIPELAMRDHGFHPLRIERVVPETADACSLVLDVPPELAATFAYDAGQFCTFRAWIDGEPHLRCYSMSSSPAVDDELQVTVKRVPGGVVSNWMNDVLAAGDEIEVTPPAGVFRLGAGDADVVAFSGGSGITPVLSLVKTALATTTRRVRLLYANRDLESIIFRGVLDDLAARHPERLHVVHHLDVDAGFVDADVVRAFVGATVDADFYVCGPGPFMDVVELGLLAGGVAADRVNIERFTPGAPELPEPTASTGTRVTIALRGRTETADHRPGATILQTARQLGMSPPYSCESGSCATCMARLVEGEVRMHANNALTDDEVAEGWVLTCQSVPTTATVSVVYEED
jgi:3-ketosteroid 9alpha-monooxygenase subunit B